MNTPDAFTAPPVSMSAAVIQAIHAYELLPPHGAPQVPVPSKGLVQHVVFGRTAASDLADVSGNCNAMNVYVDGGGGFPSVFKDGIVTVGKDDLQISPSKRNTLTRSPKGENAFAFWIRWSGETNQMPMGFNTVPETSLWFIDGMFGFNSNNGDVLGILSAPLRERWVHVVVVLCNGKFQEGCRLYLDGKPQKLTHGRGRESSEAFVWRQGPDASAEYVLGRRGPSGIFSNFYPFINGKLADFRAYSRGMNDDEVATLWDSVKHSLGSDGVLRLLHPVAQQVSKKLHPTLWLRQATSDKHVREFLAHVGRVLSAHCPFHPAQADFDLVSSAHSADPLETVVALGLTGALFEFALVKSAWSTMDAQQQSHRVRQLNATIASVSSTSPSIPDDVRHQLSACLAPLVALGAPPPVEAKTPPTL